MRPLRLAIRADASAEIGSGHVMRCLTLAGKLRERGAEIAFICAALPGNLIGYIEQQGFPVLALEGKDVQPGTHHHPPAPTTIPSPLAGEGQGEGEAAVLEETPLSGKTGEKEAQRVAELLQGRAPLDWLIVDHYRLDLAFERAMQPVAGGIMVIDDLADRRHDCAILLDQNLHLGFDARYDSLVPAECRKFLGPRYALLRPEFAEARRGLKLRSGKVGRLLVFFGGSDPSGETVKTLEALAVLRQPDLAVDVVVGVSNPLKDRLRNICADDPSLTFHCQVSNMAQLMAQADLAVGAGGSTTWERCFLGLPSITLVLAENQRSGTEAVAAAGATVNLGWWSEVSAEKLKDTLTHLFGHPEILREMQEKAFSLMEGAGGAAEEELLSAFWEKRHV